MYGDLKGWKGGPFCSPPGLTYFFSAFLAGLSWMRPSWLAPFLRPPPRHTFASVALAFNEDPTLISRTMGHHNTDMIINVYAKFIEDVRDVEGVSNFAEALYWTWA